MQIPHQPIILNRIKELNTNPKIIGRHFDLVEKELEGVQVVLTGVRMAGRTTNS